MFKDIWSEIIIISGFGIYGAAVEVLEIFVLMI